MTILMFINALLLMAIAAYMVGMAKTISGVVEVLEALKTRVDYVADDNVKIKKEVQDTLDFSLKTIQQARRTFLDASTLFAPATKETPEPIEEEEKNV